MEINEKTNAQYLNKKNAFENVKKLQEKIDKLEKDLKLIKREIEDIETEKKRAEEDKDKNAIKSAESKLEIKKAEEEKLKEQANKMKEIIDTNREKVEKYFEEIEKEPELKAHVNKIMEKQYNRKLKKVKSEENNLKILQEAIKNNPIIANNLRGMIRAEEELTKYDEELKKLDPQKDSARIAQIKNTEIPTLLSKYEKNKDMLTKTFKEKDINISEKFIEDLVKNNKFSHFTKVEKDDKGNVTKRDEINIDKTLKNISKRNMRRIDLYERTIQKIPGAVIYEDKNEDKNENKENNEKNILKKVKEKLAKDKEGHAEEEHKETALVNHEKISWWKHPIKRFKQWKQERTYADSQRKDEKLASTSKESEKFRNAYKFDAVKDYVEKKSRELEKESYNEYKKNRETKQEGREI